MKLSYHGKNPEVAPDVFIAQGAQIIGDVEIDQGSSIWPNAVIRGDVEKISIGKRTNIQDNSTLHADPGYPLTIGDEVTIGHNAILHGCTVCNNSLIGMGAIVLDGAIIGEQAFIAAGALVPPGKEIPPRSLVVGSPGKVKRTLTDEELASLKRSAKIYAEKAQIYRNEVKILP